MCFDLLTCSWFLTAVTAPFSLQSTLALAVTLLCLNPGVADVCRPILRSGLYPRRCLLYSAWERSARLFIPSCMPKLDYDPCLLRLYCQPCSGGHRAFAKPCKITRATWFSDYCCGWDVLGNWNKNAKYVRHDRTGQKATAYSVDIKFAWYRGCNVKWIWQSYIKAVEVTHPVLGVLFVVLDCICHVVQPNRHSMLKLLRDMLMMQSIAKGFKLIVQNKSDSSTEFDLSMLCLINFIIDFSAKMAYWTDKVIYDTQYVQALELNFI